MRLFLALFGAILLWIGVDMLRLAKHGTKLPTEETDKMIFGRPVRLSKPARDWIEARYLVQPGAGRLVLGLIIAAAGITMLFWSAFSDL